MRIEKEVLKFIHSYEKDAGTCWRVQIPSGTVKPIRKRGFIEKADAVEFAVKTYLSVLQNRKGVKFISNKITFREYAKQWLELKRRAEIGESTKISYEDHLERRLNPFFGNMKLADIEKFHIRNFILELNQTRTSTYLAKSSVALFKSIMKQAEADDVVSPKGISLVQTPKHKKKDPTFWSPSESAFFLNATKGHKSHDVWKFALFTGCRAGEIAGLKWDAVNLSLKIGSHIGGLEVKRIWNQNTRQMQEFTKTKENRLIPILPEVREILERRFKTRTGDYVFGNDGPLDSSHFNRKLQRAITGLKTDQIPMIHFHSLRHSFCSYLDSKGLNRRVVAEIMGHKDLNTTNRYSHVNNKMMGEEVQRWLSEQDRQQIGNLQLVVG